MGTKVQAKTYFPGSMMDLNNGLCNGMWDLYHDDRTSGSEKSQCYDSFLMRQAMDGYPGYAKEQMRQTILKQESIFRHQLQELHRLYRRQRDLMNELIVKEHYNFQMPAEASRSSHFLSQIPSRVPKEMHSLVSNFPHVDSNFGRVSISETNGIFSCPDFLKGKSTLKDSGPLNSKCSITQRRVIDLELPADVDEDNEGKQKVQNVHNSSTERAYNLADLNEPIQVEETSFSASLSNNNNDHCVTEKLQKQDFSANSSSGFWYLSKISQQNLKEREGRIGYGDSNMEEERHKKEQLSYSFADRKTKCYDNAYYDGIFSHQSNSLQADPKKALEHLTFPIPGQIKAEPQRKRTIFGVELCERNHAPSFDSSQSSNPQSDAINSGSSFALPWRKTSSSNQNASTLHHNHWLGSSDASRQIPEFFAGNKRAKNSNSGLMSSSRAGVPYQNGGCIRSSSTGVGFLSGINSKNSASDSPEEPCPTKKHNVMDGQNHHKNPERQLPSWLMTKSSLCSEEPKGKEATLYQMNLDSLQNHSQLFFKKAEMTKGAHDPKVQTDNCQGITKILGVPIIDVPENSKDLVNNACDPNVEAKGLIKENGKNNCISDLRHHIDLNLSFDEEDAPPSAPCIPEAVVKIATMEIDLEAPAVLESETDPSGIRLETPSKLPLDDDFEDTHEELVKVAAEAIMSISSSKLVTVHDTNQPPEEAPAPAPADTLLRWFADVITFRDSVNKDSPNVNNDEESIPEGMDYFEYMTLKLQETKEEYCCYKPMILDDKEEEDGLLRKRTTRKGQGKRGRQRKDFQRDVLPSIVSLSRREVTEDLQIFEEAFTDIGVSWQSSLSKRKAAAKNGRGRRRLVVPNPSPHNTPPPPPAVEQTICRQVALEEKSLGGWGKRTRRLPRQRCQNGGNHHSLALKC